MKKFIKSIITTALHKSVAANYVTCTKILLHLGADPNAFNKEGQTPLHVAASRGQAVLVNLLLAKGANPDIPNKEGQAPLHLVIKADHQKDSNILTIVKMLQEKKAKLDVQTLKGNTPLHYAIKKGNSDIVDTLLQGEGNFNIANKKGFTPLHLATAKKNSDIVEKLLKKNFNPNVSDLCGNTPLHLAVNLYGTSSIAALRIIMSSLLRYQANPDVLNHKKETPLHLAVHSNQPTIVETLLASNANPNIQNQDGDTPLHIAANYQSNYLYHRNFINSGIVLMSSIPPYALRAHDMIIKTLCEAGANANLKNSQLETPLHLAASSKDSNAIQHLLHSKADPNLLDQKNMNALHRVATPNYPGMRYSDDQEITETKEIIKALLKEGTNPHQKNLKGNTPLQIIESFRNEYLYTSLFTGISQAKNLPNVSMQPSFTQKIMKFSCAPALAL